MWGLVSAETPEDGLSPESGACGGPMAVVGLPPLSPAGYRITMATASCHRGVWGPSCVLQGDQGLVLALLW